MSENSIAQTEAAESKIWACPHGCGYHIADGPAPDGEPSTGELIADHIEEHAADAELGQLPPAACGCPVRHAQEVRGDPSDTLTEHVYGCAEQVEEAKQPEPAAARAAYTRGLREIADWLDAHPEVKLPYVGEHIPGCDLPSLPIYLRHGVWDDGPDVRAQMATIARAMGKANKRPGLVDGTFIVWREFAGFAVYAQAERDEVCERVVTGVREVTVQVPDPEALAAVPKMTVTRTVEDVEWVCAPLLAEAKS